MLKTLLRIKPSALAATLLLTWSSVVVGYEYVYNASDFATEVVNYVEGDGVPVDFVYGTPFNHPEYALGRPTIDTTGDYNAADPDTPVTVIPVYQALRIWEIVSVGENGELILKFDHQVANDPRNPAGIDLIIFGNANQSIGSTYWTNGDPAAVTISSTYVQEEPGIVSVAQYHDPQNPGPTTWYEFPDNAADTWAPTLGRIYDPENAPPEQPNNGYWGAATNPLIPFNPLLGPGDFAGETVADAVKKYGYGAGGTGFDLAKVGVDWIQYVRITNPDGSSYTPEIDAVADVDPDASAPDFDLDTDIDLDDMDMFEQCRTAPGIPLSTTEDCIPDPQNGIFCHCPRADLDRDNDVDQADFAILQKCFSGSDQPADPQCKE
jgi:hypothetical protein